MKAAIKKMLYAVILAAIITLRSCGGPADIGYREGLAERSGDFDSDWLFMLEPEGTPQLTDYDDSGWRELDLPHDWSIELDFNSDVATGVGALPGGTGWYRKYFVLPEVYEGKRISIEFGGSVSRMGARMEL